MPLTYHHAFIAALLCELGLAGCVSSSEQPGPSLIRIEEPPVDRAASVATAQEQRLQTLLHLCVRLDQRLAGPAPSAPPPVDPTAPGDRWATAVHALLTSTPPELRLRALADIVDGLPGARRAEDRMVWSRYLRLVVALEHSLLDTELQLHRRLAQPAGSIHEAARRRSESFMAEGPAVISARDGRISARALAGGVPIDAINLSRGRELARELRLLGFYVTAARPVSAEMTTPAHPVQPDPLRTHETPPDDLLLLIQSDARRLFLASAGAEAEWAVAQARLQAAASAAVLDEAYRLRRERMFAPTYREFTRTLSDYSL